MLYSTPLNRTIDVKDHCVPQYLQLPYELSQVDVAHIPKFIINFKDKTNFIMHFVRKRKQQQQQQQNKNINEKHAASSTTANLNNALVS